jgi:hypothetical protein
VSAGSVTIGARARCLVLVRGARDTDSESNSQGRPPARWYSSQRYCPAGWILTSRGSSYPTLSQSSLLSSTPMCLATALRWMGALVEPPIAVQRAMAFSNASLVMISDGLTSWRTSWTMRCPVWYAQAPRSRYGAGMDAEPGRAMPRASAMAFMVLAVPMVLQCPTLRHEHCDGHERRCFGRKTGGTKTRRRGGGRER